jgi:hypothetical protein
VLNVTPSEAISTVKGFIDIAKELKGYLTPKYQEAADALYNITNKVFTGEQKLLAWVHAFERVDLNDPNRRQFIKLRQGLESFRLGKGYDSINFHSRQIGTIYNDKIKSHLRKWLARDKTKLQKSESIFYDLGHIDNGIMKIAQEVMKKLEESVNQIENTYDSGTNIRKKSLDDFKQLKNVLVNQSDELRELRNNFIDLSGKPLMVEQKEDLELKELKQDIELILSDC